MEKVKVTTKRGKELLVSIDGYREEPEILVDGHNARIQHWDKMDWGLFIEGYNAYAELGEEIQKIDEVVSKLPHKVKYITLEEETLDADGDKVIVQRYSFDSINFCEVDGYLFGETEITNLLRKYNIRKISYDELPEFLKKYGNIEERKRREEEADRVMETIEEEEELERAGLEQEQEKDYDQKEDLIPNDDVEEA